MPVQVIPVQFIDGERIADFALGEVDELFGEIIPLALHAEQTVVIRPRTGAALLRPAVLVILGDRHGEVERIVRYDRERIGLVFGEIILGNGQLSVRKGELRSCERFQRVHIHDGSDRFAAERVFKHRAAFADSRYGGLIRADFAQRLDVRLQLCAVRNDGEPHHVCIGDGLQIAALDGELAVRKGIVRIRSERFVAVLHRGNGRRVVHGEGNIRVCAERIFQPVGVRRGGFGIGAGGDIERTRAREDADICLAARKTFERPHVRIPDLLPVKGNDRPFCGDREGEQLRPVLVDVFGLCLRGKIAYKVRALELAFRMIVQEG